MEITKRALDLYTLLLSNPDKWFSQKEICTAIPGYIYKERNNDRCPGIRDDKLLINSSADLEKIVVMKDYKFKIANEEEYFEERSRHVRRLKNQVQEIKNMDFKFARNNQGKLSEDLENIEFWESLTQDQNEKLI